MTLPHGSPAWLVTGYHEARAALVDPRFAAVETPLAHLLDPALRAATENSMLSMDGPGHARLRKLVTAAFTRRQVERLAPRVQQITDELLAPLARQGSPFDLLEEFAYPFQVAVICELLGVPEDRRGGFGKWSQITVNALVMGVDALSAALTEFVEYLRELVALKRAEPGDDLITALIAARDDGDRLSEDELTSMSQLLLIAGHETTLNLIANAVRALLSTPGAWDLLRAEPERVPAVLEEALRFNGPVQTATERVTTADVEIAGTTIPAGAHVRIALLAANRDPSACPAAEDFDVTRRSSQVSVSRGRSRTIDSGCSSSKLSSYRSRAKSKPCSRRSGALRQRSRRRMSARSPTRSHRGPARRKRCATRSACRVGEPSPQKRLRSTFRRQSGNFT